MVTGEPKAVAERLLEMKDQAQADEIVVVTPSLDRERRIASLRGARRRLAQRRLTTGRSCPATRNLDHPRLVKAPDLVSESPASARGR